MNVTLTTPNAALSVSADDVKRELRIEGDTSQDTLLEDLIEDRERWAERKTGLAMLESTWTATWDRDDVKCRLAGIDIDERTAEVVIALPVRPVRSVTSVKVTNSSHEQSEIAADDYTVFTMADGSAALYIDAGEVSGDLRTQACLEVVFVAGYDAGDQPRAVLEGIRKGAAYDYEHSCEDMDECKEALRAVSTERRWRVG